MEYITFSDSNKAIQYAIFIKHTSANRKALLSYYIHPLEVLGILPEQVVVVSLDPEGKSFTAKATKELLEKVAKGIDVFNIKNILIANGDLYKYIIGVTKTTNCFGEIKKGKLPGYEDTNIVLSIDYNALLYNESLRFKLDNSIEVFAKACSNAINIEKDIIHTRYTPVTALEIENCLESLMEYNDLTCDLETESLRFEKARIVTVAFAINKHEGVVFSVDTKEEEAIKKLLYFFFKNYKGRFIFHNALYDCKVIIYQLFMENNLDIDGLREGLITFNENVEDTLLITYLATNSTQEVPLGLKENSYEFAGNYGIDVTDVHAILRANLLTYNLKDALSTWYVMEKHYPTMVADDQEDIYRTIFLPSIMPNLYMTLIGMPMTMKKVHALDENLTELIVKINKELQTIKPIVMAIAILKEQRRVKDNETRVNKAKNPDKIKIKTLDDISDEEFNPNSDKQKQVLLYEILKLPIINTTDGGAPACDDATLKILVNHTEKRTDNIITLRVLELLRDHAAASIILSTFIHAFIEYAFTRDDGTVWLNGNKKLGGTQSGRLSSNQPNMENLPNHSKYGKMIKECFEAPKGYLIGGADFSSLEDRINAILTQDKNKIKVYTDGYDGHSLRTFSYFKDQLPDIVDTVESINSIEKKYPLLRFESKKPTFALTYQGTWHTMVKNLGFSAQDAKRIEASYHELYKESDIWTEEQLEFATEHGYVECAFGLRLRTPILGRTIRTLKNNIYIADKEGRSAVNAITQSWGMLINRTAIAIINKIIYSNYYDKIYPINTIHDAIYFLFLNDPIVIQWLNTNLIREMKWNDHPKIQSTDVPMGANLSIGKNWADQHDLSNSALLAEITAIQEIIASS